MMEKIERPEIKMNDHNWVTAQKYLGKQLMKRGVDTAILPGGIAIDARAWRSFKHSVNVKTYVMNHPEQLLKDAEPRCRYVWRPRTDPNHTTEGLVKVGKLVPVDFDRVDLKAPGAENVYEYAGSGKDDQVTGFVACGDFGLFEVPPVTAYEWFSEPVDSTFARLAGLKPMLEEASQEYGRRAGLNVRGSDITISDTQDVSTEKRHPITK